MLVASKMQQLYVGHLQSVPISRGLFFIDNTEALSIMCKGMEFDDEELIRVVSALGEIKKKKESRKKFSDDGESIFADTSGGSKQLKT